MTTATAFASRPDGRRSLQATLLIGAALMAGVDEIIFHQLLSWHHFYDLSTLKVGLFSDGLLHAAELLALVAGFFLYADVRRQGAIHRHMARAGFFLGAGGFQLFDGIVNHKILRLHQIRYGVNVIPYDVAWNVAGAVLLLVGFVCFRQARRASGLASR